MGDYLTEVTTEGHGTSSQVIEGDNPGIIEKLHFCTDDNEGIILGVIFIGLHIFYTVIDRNPLQRCRREFMTATAVFLVTAAVYWLHRSVLALLLTTGWAIGWGLLWRIRVWWEAVEAENEARMAAEDAASH